MSNRRPSTANVPATSTSSRWTLPLLISAVLAALTFTVYSGVRNYDYVYYDDPDYVFENHHVMSGLTWPNVAWAFRTGHASNWHPLTWLSHMLDVELFGNNPGCAHLTNLFLHIANTVLLFVLLKQMTGANWRSAAVAGLFALHPLHVESVAWIAERKDVLSAFFGLGALLAYRSYVTHKTSKAYVLSLALFALGLLSKPMLVTWPFVMLLLDYWPLQRFTFGAIAETRRARLNLIWEKLPFFALSGAVCVVTLLTQKAGGAVRLFDSFSTASRIQNALMSYVRYLEKTVWPADLAVFYPHTKHWEWSHVLLAALLLAALCFAVFRYGRRFPFLPVGWFWFVGTLIPVIGLVQVGSQAMADRYTYLPLIGVFIAGVWGLYELQRRWQLPEAAVGTLLIVVLGASAFATSSQLQHWRNSESLFRHASEVTEDNALAALNLGAYLAKQGRLDEAIPLYESALRFDPTFAETYNNLGAALLAQGKLNEAISCFQHLLQAAPDHVEGHDNLGIALAMQGDLAGATSHFRQAIRQDPEHLNSHFNLGNVLAMQNDFKGAASEYVEVLRFKPDHAQAHCHLGATLAQLGDRDQAIVHLKEALRLEPNYSQAKEELRKLGVEVN